MHFGRGVITPEGLGPRREEERIVLAPHGQEWWLFRAEVLLELGVERDVAGVIQEQVELNLIISWARQQRGIELVGLRGDQRLVCDPVKVLTLGGLRFQELAQRGTIFRRRLGPVLL